MYYCVMLVVEDPSQSWAVLEAWEAAGAPGVTILDSFETAEVRPVDRPRSGLFSGLERLLQGDEERHRTLFTIVQKESQVRDLIEAARSVIGEFDEERTGLLFALPVSRVYGLRETGE